MTVAIPTNNHAAIVLPDDGESAANQLIVWAGAAKAAFALAEQLCASRFVPAGYRNKPIEGAAAIMAGAEVGLSPMAAMRAFDDIQGTPAPKAITLRAIALSRGHDLRIVKSTQTECKVVGRRKGETEWQETTWDIPRAQRMGLLEKSQWKSQPGAMLVARATSEMARWIAADAIMGMPYSAEEIRDGDGDMEVRVGPRRVTAADILDEPQPAIVATPEPPQPMTDAQRKRMFVLWDEIGYGGEENRDQRLAIIGKVLGLDGPVESSNVLTFEQADVVIAALDAKRRHMEAAQAAQAEQVEAGDAEAGGGES